jgi:hypothetical protein
MIATTSRDTIVDCSNMPAQRYTVPQFSYMIRAMASQKYLDAINRPIGQIKQKDLKAIWDEDEIQSDAEDEEEGDTRKRPKSAEK